jgi:hypothetical protein
MSKTTDLIYTGRHGAVNVAMPDGTEQPAQWGETFTTTDEHAASLLEQPENWKRAPKRAADNKAATAADKE